MNEREKLSCQRQADVSSESNYKAHQATSSKFTKRFNSGIFGGLESTFEVVYSESGSCKMTVT